MKKLVYILSAVFLCAACADEEWTASTQEGTGTLILQGMTVETVVNDVRSRASLDNVPTAEEFTVSVVNLNGAEYALGSGETTYELPAGTYTLKAVYGEDVVSTTTPYFYGETEVTIEAGVQTTATLTASLQSAVIRPVMTEALLEQFAEYTLNVSSGEATYAVENGRDVFVPAKASYTVSLVGKNQLGEEKSACWELNSLNACTRYLVQCDADLPSFTLPEQLETDAWSRFIYITPMTADNLTSHPEMAEKVLGNIVYEACAAHSDTWIPATQVDGRWVIKGLEPQTEYTVRSRFGAVTSSNTQTLTTESAQALVNGDMESWSNDPYDTYGLQEIYRYYAGVSSSDRAWGTRNTLTMDGVRDGSSTLPTNQRTAYRWNSCTIPTTDAVSGNAAEIRTMALANFNINSGTGMFVSRSKMASNVLANANVFVGWLYTGTTDVTSASEEPASTGIAHSSRPVSLSFSYKYAPYNADSFTVSAALFDENGNRIAYVDDFTSGAVQDSYSMATLNFVYENPNVKAASIYVMFRSGENSTTDAVQHIEGSYSVTPWSLDTFVGSVLKIDNVTLNYDYE